MIICLFFEQLSGNYWQGCGRDRIKARLKAWILLYFATMQGYLLDGKVKAFARSQNGLDFLSLEKLMRKFMD